jgi:hypothetical protein
VRRTWEYVKNDADAADTLHTDDSCDDGAMALTISLMLILAMATFCMLSGMEVDVE